VKKSNITFSVNEISVKQSFKVALYAGLSGKLFGSRFGDESESSDDR